VTAIDMNGDGVTDAVEVSASNGKRRIHRIFIA
jgi:hypothetical protein